MGSNRYTKWKQACKESLQNHKYCANCGSTTLLELDHIQSRYTNPKKEYDITNCQYLCNSCNQLKSADNVDYRTNEIKEAQWEYINTNLNGKSIVS
jgi:5-methylcytosine-specific restriction endonuclease McrA